MSILASTHRHVLNITASSINLVDTPYAIGDMKIITSQKLFTDDQVNKGLIFLANGVDEPLHLKSYAGLHTDGISYVYDLMQPLTAIVSTSTCTGYSIMESDTLESLVTVAQSRREVIQQVINYIATIKGQPNGLAPLGSDSKVPDEFLPPARLFDVHEVNSEAEMLALDPVNKNDMAIRTDLDNQMFILKDLPATTLSNWLQVGFSGNFIRVISDSDYGNPVKAQTANIMLLGAQSIYATNSATDSVLKLINLWPSSEKVGITLQANSATATIDLYNLTAPNTLKITTSSQKMVFDDTINIITGNVGIGISAPAEKLDIAGNVVLNNNNTFKIRDTSGVRQKVLGTVADAATPTVFYPRIFGDKLILQADTRTNGAVLEVSRTGAGNVNVQNVYLYGSGEEKIFIGSKSDVGNVLFPSTTTKYVVMNTKLNVGDEAGFMDTVHIQAGNSARSASLTGSLSTTQVSMFVNGGIFWMPLMASGQAYKTSMQLGLTAPDTSGTRKVLRVHGTAEYSSDLSQYDAFLVGGNTSIFNSTLAFSDQTRSAINIYRAGNYNSTTPGTSGSHIKLIDASNSVFYQQFLVQGANAYIITSGTGTPKLTLDQAQLTSKSSMLIYQNDVNTALSVSRLSTYESGTPEVIAAQGIYTVNAAPWYGYFMAFGAAQNQRFLFAEKGAGWNKSVDDTFYANFHAQATGTSVGRQARNVSSPTHTTTVTGSSVVLSVYAIAPDGTSVVKNKISSLTYTPYGDAMTGNPVDSSFLGYDESLTTSYKTTLIRHLGAVAYGYYDGGAINNFRICYGISRNNNLIVGNVATADKQLHRLQVNGPAYIRSISQNARKSSATTTNMTLDDYWLGVDATTENKTVYLIGPSDPNPTQYLGQIFVVQKMDSSANTVTVQDPSGSINNDPSYLLTIQYSSATFMLVSLTGGVGGSREWVMI